MNVKKVTVQYMAWALFAGIIAVRAEVVALWDFEEGTVDSNMVVSTDSVSGLIAVPATVNPPIYIAGADGVAKGAGILRVEDASGLLNGFSEFHIKFDIDLTQDATGGTQVFLRNGWEKVSFDIYLQADNTILAWLVDTNGTEQTVKAVGSDLSADAGWQTVSVVWDGSAMSISVDGAAQGLNNTTDTSVAVELGALQAANVDLAIGGALRSSGTTTQYLYGRMDNIIISNTSVLPVSASISSLASVSGDLIRLTVSTDSPVDFYPKSTTNLATAVWTGVAHSDDGLNPFVVTNLSYSTQAGADRVIYLEADSAVRFFGLGEE
ncbi:LamG-like jellyroll fold domain-containing protein [Tichowtungia aerotolerans]|uniref:Uncharacterized protein n=1 Tax=Tichowtungia aerotolerans TaxID=2697043 RepID=A0A6P1MBF9_9BACT|nr:LamG-like jellyroll fold domain-containing protein [Tichowtungia aerotolerans]QHI69428.1 hypothetical protein GT409_08160 [Tichowtungia aerotolerans]